LELCGLSIHATDGDYQVTTFAYGKELILVAGPACAGENYGT
jgi:hypothetical protein